MTCWSVDLGEVLQGRAYAIDDGREKLVATMNATMMTITGRDGIKH